MNVTNMMKSRQKNVTESRKNDWKKTADGSAVLAYKQCRDVRSTCFRCREMIAKLNKAGLKGSINLRSALTLKVIIQGQIRPILFDLRTDW